MSITTEWGKLSDALRDLVPFSQLKIIQIDPIALKIQLIYKSCNLIDQEHF